jgi:AcrR family transcriptional regulator
MTATGTDTRSRILDAAWSLVRRRGASSATMAEIAGEAGVSRQLVYFHFDNRAGLLLAMARDHDTRTGFVERAVATRSLPPAEGLAKFLESWFAYLPEILPVARALEAAAAGGDEGGAAALRDRIEDLREAIRIAIERVEAAGMLAGGWTVASATDWVWARSHLSGWQLLVVERGWDPGDYTRRAIASILAEVLSGPAGGTPKPGTGV